MTADGKIVDVSLAELKNYSQKLVSKITKSGYTPDHILYVERAGLFVGYEMKKIYDCTISGVYASRGGGSLKSTIKIILRYLPRSVTHLLRKFEAKSQIHNFKKSRNVYIEKIYPPKAQSILIVDDAIDTGSTLLHVLNFLENKGYNRNCIKIAVITATQNNPVCKADFSLFHKVLFAFPWSYDSKEYDQAWKLYRELKSSFL